MTGDYQQIDTDTNYVYCERSDHRNGRNSWSYIAAARRPLRPYVGVTEEKPASNPWQQSRFTLGPGVPNPSVSGARIASELAAPGQVSLRVYDQAGKLVNTVLNSGFAAGPHSMWWGGRGAAGRQVGSGVYYYSLTVGDLSSSGRLVLAR
jgi:hypothetical protein